MNRITNVALAAIGLLLVYGVPVAPASAAGGVGINVVGASPNEITLQLVSPQGNVVTAPQSESDRRRGFWVWSGLNPGRYTVRTLRNGQPVGQDQQVDVRDNETAFLAYDVRTGMIRPVSRGASMAMSPLSVGVMGGWKFVDVDATATRTGVAETGRGVIEGDMASYGAELRYELNPAQQIAQGLGAGLFVMGSVLAYTGHGQSNRFLNTEAAAGNEVGGRVSERYGGQLGIGLRFNPMQRLGLALMAGAHFTRTAYSILDDQTPGGGRNNVITENKWVVGPWVGAELSTPVSVMQNYGPLELFVRGQMQHMPSHNMTAQTQPFNFTTRTDFDSSQNWGLLAGVRIPLNWRPVNNNMLR
jgi:hypothetical protein